ncbi:shikimate kinase [Pseudoramibacter faecis]|uniref:shikimate kinase n=1 Tax=Pseudoramibacter faecis TaxID=3108534 RepID=UPI002E7727F7|nr:shikimate kinase [Pseudoramibacter sp. HA2172]
MALPHIIALIGYMATGKSTVGQAMAKACGYDFIDTDEAIVQAAGKSIPAIFEEDGERVFRAAETETLRQILTAQPQNQGLILACGGGLPLEAENRALLAGHCFTVQLIADSETIARRVEAQGKRPLLAAARDHADLVARIDRMKARRKRDYEAATDMNTETDILPIEDVVDAILFFAEMAQNRRERLAN